MAKRVKEARVKEVNPLGNLFSKDDGEFNLRGSGNSSGVWDKEKVKLIWEKFVIPQAKQELPKGKGKRLGVEKANKLIEAIKKDNVELDAKTLTPAMCEKLSQYIRELKLEKVYLRIVDENDKIVRNKAKLTSKCQPALVRP